MLTLRDHEGIEYPLIATIKHKSELNGTDDLEVTIHPKLNPSIFNLDNDSRQGNLIDFRTLTPNRYIASHGGLASSGVGVSATDFIRVYPDTEYIHISNIPVTGGMFVAYYDSNQKFSRRVSPPSDQRQRYSIEPRSNEHFIRISHIGLANNSDGVEVIRRSVEVEKLWEIDFNNVTYKIIHTKQQTKGNGFYLTVRAMPIFYWDLDKSIIHENHNGSHTANSAFSVVFGGSGYNFVLVDFSPAVSWEGFGGGSTRLELFKRLLERYNYEFTIQGKTVYMHHQIGNDTNYVYKYGLNASNVSQSTDAASMFTHIKGFGDFEDREDYYEQANLRLEYTSPLAQLLGTYEGKPIVDGRITRTETMQNAMQKAVEDSLQISVEGNLHDVRKMGYDIAVPLKGDRVWLQDDRLGLETEIRLHTITTTYDVRGEVIGCDVVFGSQTAGERHKAQINTLSKNFRDLLEGNLKLPIISLEQVGRDMIESIHNASSEIIFGDYGMRAISKDNPNHVFGVNSEGWYISQDGGATPRTIATANGIYADALFAGTLWLTNEMNIESDDGYLNITGSRFYMKGKNSDQSVEISPDGLEINGGAIQINGGLPDSQIENSDKWNQQGTHIDENGIYTGTVTAQQVQVGFNDVSNNVSISPNGLTINGGALNLNASDGRNVIIDGYMRAARVSNINFFNAGAFNGESDIEFNGMNWIWNDGNEHRIHYIDDEYKGRYLDFVVGVGLVTGSNPSNASVTITITTPDDTVAGSATYEVTTTNWNLERKTIRVDLQALYNSIPDYRSVFLYMQVQVTSGTGARAAFRVNRGEFND